MFWYITWLFVFDNTWTSDASADGLSLVIFNTINVTKFISNTIIAYYSKLDNQFILFENIMYDLGLIIKKSARKRLEIIDSL